MDRREQVKNKIVPCPTAVVISFHLFVIWLDWSDILDNNDRMSSVKRTLGESAVIAGHLHRFENKQNLNSEQLREMIDLLRAYEALCIQREDFAGAESVKNKIQQLVGQDLVHKREKIAVLEKEQIEVICKEGDEEIRKFQQTWDQEIQSLIEELKATEEELVAAQRKETEEVLARMAAETAPKVKFSSHVLERRNYLSNLIKARSYKEAEVVKNTLREMEAEQEARWAQKFEEKKKLRAQKLQKKQLGELQAMRLKLQAIFNQKIKERDRKFQILLKKNRKRRVESTKPSRERIRTRNGILTESKFNINASFL